MTPQTPVGHPFPATILSKFEASLPQLHFMQFCVYNEPSNAYIPNRVPVSLPPPQAL